MRTRFFAGAAVAAVLALCIATVASAASGYSLFGDAQIVSPGNASNNAAQATSTGSSGFGGVDFAFPTGLTVSQLQTLSTDYMFPSGSCGLGSPRFSVEVTNGTTTGNLFFYLGPPPNYTACPGSVWSNSGNLAAPANLVDASQLGGAFYEPYATVQASYGSYTVLDVSLVVDGSSQTVDFDNTNVNGTTVTYEAGVPTSKDQCKNGGWQSLVNGSGASFKNQGDCVSFFASSN